MLLIVSSLLIILPLVNAGIETSTIITEKKGCNIENDKVIENGTERKLTDEEKKQLADYAIALDEYFKAAFHPRALSQPKKKLPKFPEICKADKVVSEHHVVAFDGCSITDDQLYIDGKFSRKLTADEVKQLQEFRDGVEKFKATIDDYLREEMAAAMTGKKITTKQPQPPSPPKICPTKPQKVAHVKEQLTANEETINH